MGAVTGETLRAIEAARARLRARTITVQAQPSRPVEAPCARCSCPTAAPSAAGLCGNCSNPSALLNALDDAREDVASCAADLRRAEREHADTEDAESELERARAELRRAVAAIETDGPA